MQRLFKAKREKESMEKASKMERIISRWQEFKEKRFSEWKPRDTSSIVEITNIEIAIMVLTTKNYNEGIQPKESVDCFAKSHRLLTRYYRALEKNSDVRRAEISDFYGKSLGAHERAKYIASLRHRSN